MLRIFFGAKINLWGSNTEATSSPGHNYGYAVRSSKGFVIFYIEALQTDGQTSSQYNIDKEFLLYTSFQIDNKI